MVREQKIRVVLFYLSVSIFFFGLPFIISFALGYKFDNNSWRFAKTGLIVLKTQPAGADIYLNKKLLSEKTSATLNELMPGKYSIRLELENHSPWSGEVKVEGGKVTSLDNIILFPLRPHIKKLNKGRLLSFFIDQDREIAYCIDPDNSAVFRSDLSGEHYERVSDFIMFEEPPVKYKISPNGLKLLYFNQHKIGIAYLQSRKNSVNKNLPFVMDYNAGSIIDVFWHSDSYHLVLISNKEIQVREAKPASNPVVLAGLTKTDTSAFYDVRTDTLYFLDSQMPCDEKFYDNLYKLELNSRIFLLPELIRLKYNEKPKD